MGASASKVFSMHIYFSLQRAKVAIRLALYECIIFPKRSNDPNREGTLNEHLSTQTIASIRGPEILDILPDGAYLTDRDRKIVFWSKSAERILGWSATEVAGKNCSDNLLVHVDSDGHPLCGQEYCPLHRCIVTGLPSEEPILVYAQHRSGVRIPVEVSVAPIKDDNGTVVGGIELFRDFSQLEFDLARARNIQTTLLESNLPADPRLTFDIQYTPSSVVGGDFYRIEKLDSQRYVIMLADVMGHGVASALYTMLLRQLWEDARKLLPTPAAFATELNGQLRKLAAESGYFATAVCLVVNAANGQIQYIRAGHPAPILIHEKSAVPLPDPSQPALGMFPDISYAEMQTVMQPGDSLVLYTDGATEVCNLNEQDLDTDGLANMLSTPPDGSDALPHMSQVEEAILRFSGSLRLADDLTLIAIKRTTATN